MRATLLGEKRSRYGQSPSELVRCVRNLQQHWKELPPASYSVLAFGGRPVADGRVSTAARDAAAFTVHQQNKCLYSSLVASGLFPFLAVAVWRTLGSLGVTGKE